MRFDRRLLKLAQESPAAILLTVLLGLGGGILTVVQASALSRVVAAVFLGEQGLAGVSNLLVALLIVLSLRAACAAGSELAGSTAAIKIKTALRQRLFAHLLALGPSFVLTPEEGEDEHSTATLTTLAVEGIEALDAYFSQYLPQVALAALVPVTFLLFVFPIDFLSGLILFLTAPLIPVFMVLIGSLAEALTRRQWLTLSRMSAYFLDVIQGLTELKTLGRSREQAGVIEQVSERFRLVTMGVLRVTFLSALALELVSTLSTAVVAVTVGLRLLYGRIGFEEAFFVLLLAPEFYQPMRQLGARFHAGMAGVEAAKKIFAVLEKQPHVNSSSAGFHEKPGQAPDQIDFEQVSYTYPDGRAGVRELSFSLKRGEKVTLVGASGSGKSTTVALLLRFLQPQQGEIRINGCPLEGFSTEDWRSQVAWVPQSPYLFAGSLEENIRLGKPGASQEEVVRAARQANIHAFIQSLPQGYATQAGERGARLSGGQAQRIALARAFLKDAPVLILDEGTANLDAESEAQLREAVDRLARGRAVLVIAHHLSAAAGAAQILVFDQGQIVERGTHAQLIQQAGLYQRLIAAQILKEGEQAGDAGVVPEAEARRPGPARAGPGEHQAGQIPARAVLARLIKLLLPFRGWVLLSVLLGFATIGSSIGLLTTSAYVISAAALHPTLDAISVAIVGVRFFGITRGVFRYLERLATHTTTFHLLARLRVGLYAALEPLAPARLLGQRSGDLLARIVGDIETLENFYVRAVAPPLVALLVAALAGLFLGLYNPRLALALLISLALAGGGVPLLARRLSRAPGKASISARGRLSAELVDGIQGMPDLLAYSAGPRHQERVASASMALGASQRQMGQITALQTGLMSLLNGLAMWTVLFLAIPLVAGRQIPGVHLAVIVLAAMTAFEAVQPLPAAAQVLESSLAAAGRLFELADAVPEIKEPDNPAPLPDRFDLEVRGLSFAYPSEPGMNRQANFGLHALSFCLPQGKHIALVGPNGSGKSTLIQLLLRFWNPQEGGIFLDGENLHTYSPDALRKKMAVVSQRGYLFNASLRDNLLLARPQASLEEIESAVRSAELQQLIESLPEKYDTWSGEGGLRLSGGERQRLALARALLKDAPLLVLDEPFSHLDSLTGARVLGRILEQAQGRSLLLITHHFTGLEAMDEILVLEGGCVVQRGRHAELLAQEGLYRRLWERQTRVLQIDPAQPARKMSLRAPDAPGDRDNRS